MMAVAAAVSVPFSSTITLAPWRAAEIMIWEAMFSKGAPAQNPRGQSHSGRSVGGRAVSTWALSTNRQHNLEWELFSLVRVRKGKALIVVRRQPLIAQCYLSDLHSSPRLSCPPSTVGHRAHGR